jgi:NAD(P)-dependent dehydrogenase (short-subunit alcohol dehydrogenase family)
MGSLTVLITGASGGIGRAVAAAFGERGAHVVVGARSESALADTAEAVRAAGGTATVAPADIRDENEFFEALADTGAAPIDVLVAAAGISPNPPGETPLTDESYEHFDAALATNVRGLFATLREGIQFMSDSGRVLVPSGKVARESKEGMGAYAVSKAGAEGVARGFAADADQTVGVVYPGLVATDLTGGRGRDPDSVAELFTWAATECPAEELDGSVVDLRDWKR